MSLLFKVVFSSCCRSTHHKLALDALRHLRGDLADEWMDVFLRWYSHYLEGAKAPDDEFKDFKNHVLHVRDGYWGGALTAARKWYDRTVASLKQENWRDAVYSAGVLSHYFSDPFMPLHTGQSEAEGAVHRACEWSVTKSYGELQNILQDDLGGYPRLEAPTGDTWLDQMIKEGADHANTHYEAIIDHYDLAKGVKDPSAGLDQELKDRLASCLGRAVVGLARVLEKAIDEAGVEPPFVNVTLQGFFTTLQVPFRMVANHVVSQAEREQIEAIYAEVQRTGKCLENLPEDDKQIRELHAEEVRHITLAELDKEEPRPAGKQHGTGKKERYTDVRPLTTLVLAPKPQRLKLAEETRRHSPPREAIRTETSRREERPREEARPIPASPPQRISEPQPLKIVHPERAPSATAPVSTPARAPNSSILRFHLERDQDVEDAPSIGNKTAERLKSAGVNTVDDLLKANPDSVAARLKTKHILPATIRQWQAEASLALRIPELRRHDAQILVGSGLTEPAEIATLSPAELLELVTPFVESSEGERVLRGGSRPNLAEVTDWIRWSGQARTLKAA